MRRKEADAAIGVFVFGALGLLVWAMSGAKGLAYAAILIISGGLVIRLFESQSKWPRVLAILMLPALLLTYLKPKSDMPPEGENKKT